MPIFTRTSAPAHPRTGNPRPLSRRLAAAATDALRRHAPLLWQLAAALMGVLLGAGQVYGGSAPFGLALVLGCSPAYTLAAAAGTVGGSLLFQPLETALKLTGAVIAAVAARSVARQLGLNRVAVAATVAGVVLLLEQGITAFGLGLAIDPAQNVLFLCTALLAAGFGAAIHTMPAEKPRGACLWLALLAACLQRFTAPLFAPGLLLAALGGLCAAYAGTLEQSAVLAVILAAAVTAASPTLCYAALAVALGTIAAAAFCPGEHLHCVGVFALGCTLGALAAPDFSAALLLGCSGGGAALLYLLLPVSVLRGVFPPAAPPAASQNLSAAARRLSTVADTLSDIATTVNAVCERQSPPRGESFDYVVDYAAQHICQGCARRGACWVKGYSNAMDGLYQLRPALETRGRAEIEDLAGSLSVCVHPSDLCAAVTHGYRLWCSRRQTRARANVLRGALTEQYSAMATALAQLADRLGRAGLPDPRREARVSQLFASIGLDPLECTVNTDIAGRVTAGVTVPRCSFSDEECRALTAEMSRICRRGFDLPEITACRTVTMLSFGERPLYRAVFGLSCRAAGVVSGDACEQFCDHAGRAQMLLCDGMGTGKAAAVDGKMAARLTGQLLRAGFAAESAARLVNVALGLKSAEQESSATLDLLTVDLFTGRAGLFKAGAAPSILVNGGVPCLAEGSSLPIGILDSVMGRSNSFSLNSGDWVVLVSDGVLCDGTEWLLQQVQLCLRLGHTPAQMAEILADSAVRRSGAHRDDITVAVLQLQKAEK